METGNADFKALFTLKDQDFGVKTLWDITRHARQRCHIQQIGAEELRMPNFEFLKSDQY